MDRHPYLVPVARRAGGRYAFGGDSIFVEVGCYLGRSLCSLAELVCQAGNGITLIGVDTCRGSGPEGQRDTDRAQGRSAAWRRNHGGAVASQRDCVRLHRHGALLISSSVAASVLFQDDSLTMGPHRMRTTTTTVSRRTSRRGLRKSPAAAGCPATTTTPTNGRASLGRRLTRYRRASLVDVSMALDQAVTRLAERS